MNTFQQKLKLHQLKRTWASQGLTRHFFVMFILAAVLPLLLLSFLFLTNIEELVGIRNQELLQTGVLFSQEIILDEIDRLELTGNQLAEGFRSANVKNSLPSQEMAAAALWKQMPLHRQLPFITFENQQQQVLGFFISSPFPYWDSSTQMDNLKLALHDLMDRAQQGTMVHELVSVPLPNGENTILLAVVVPQYQAGQNQAALKGRPSRLFVLCQDLHFLEGHPDLKHLPKELRLRVLSVSNAGDISTIVNGPPTLYTSALEEQALLRHLESGHTFTEKLQGAFYSSLAFPLTTVQNKQLGYLVISISKQSLDQIKNKNTVYLLVYLIVAMLLIVKLGTWFNRTFIQPIQSLSHATERVSQGDLDIRVPVVAAYPEMDQTLRNFNQMLDELQEKETLRETFVSTLTHDLRTPLIAQKRALEFLKFSINGNLDPESATLFHQLENSHQHLLEMINHVLENFQYESGAIHLQRERVNLHHLVQAALDSLNPIASEKQIALINDVPDALFLWLDSRQFRRVFVNLIGNSLDNIEESCTVRISATASDTHCRITLEDNGPGIAPNILPHLFNRYPAIHNRQQKIGFGLGLYICKMIVELHGGTISVESHLGGGSKFIIELPKQRKVQS